MDASTELACMEGCRRQCLHDADTFNKAYGLPQRPPSATLDHSGTAAGLAVRASISSVAPPMSETSAEQSRQWAHCV